MYTVGKEKLIDANYSAGNNYMRLVELPIKIDNSHIYNKYVIEVVDIVKMSFMDKGQAQNVFDNLTSTNFEVIR